MRKKDTVEIIPIEAVANRIFIIRGQRVMFDSDLANLYAVETRALVQAVKRNAARFPPDFMFQLSPGEFAHWRSQIVISNPGAKMGLRRAPYVFTEHGALQLASVLKSARAVEMSILVVRAFVRLRELLATNKELAAQFKKLERRLDMSDEAIAELYEMVRQLMTPPDPPKRRIGF
ncbi:MAG: ORF6N domain-containing protein [Burkholderiales bacterium]